MIKSMALEDPILRPLWQRGVDIARRRTPRPCGVQSGSPSFVGATVAP
jgi:hypothetical protein